MDVNGVAAVITGGANGMGRAAVELVAEAGSRVAVFDIAAEAGRALASASRDFVYDPKVLEKSEERLFALRAAARKYKVQVGELSALRMVISKGWFMQYAMGDGFDYEPTPAETIAAPPTNHTT